MNLHLNNRNAIGCAGTVLFFNMATCAPFIFSPHFLPVLIEKKKSGVVEWSRHPHLSLFPPRCLHGACQRGGRNECNGAIYSNCCRLKKEKISFSKPPPPPPPVNPPFFPPVEDREQCNCPSFVCCVPTSSLTLLVIMSSLHPSIPLVCFVPFLSRS